MSAAVLKCPMCGASASKDTHRCSHCGARLATVACPACFGMLFIGAKFCPHCGARAARMEAPDLPELSCPRCAVGLHSLTLGDIPLRECPKCSGLWVDTHTLDVICHDPARQVTLLGDCSTHEPSPLEKKIRYLPCPACRKLMNRVNFARCSSVVVDVCRVHGTWFDQNELQRIVQFIQQGGFIKAKKRELQELEERRRRMEASLEAQRSSRAFDGRMSSPDLCDGITAAASAIMRSMWD